MKTKAAVAALLAALLLTGCVSRGDYDALAREREELSVRAEELAREIESLKGDVAQLQSYAKDLHEENESLREALDAAKKEAEAQRKKIEEFVRLVEELEAQNRSTLPQFPSMPPLPAADETVRSVMDTFSQLWELAGRSITGR